MSDIVGRIAPSGNPVMTEGEQWPELCRHIFLKDSQGRRHGLVIWIESEVDDEFLESLHQLYLTATRYGTEARPSCAS